MIERRQPCAADVRAIASELREDDRRELFATKHSDDWGTLAASLGAHLDGLARCWCWHGEPVALMGLAPQWPGVWTGWAFGTACWSAVVRDMTKHARRIMLPTIASMGAHRVQVFTLSDRHDSHDWLRRCFGFQREATLRGFGREGEDFDVMVLGPDAMEVYRGVD